MKFPKPDCPKSKRKEEEVNNKMPLSDSHDQVKSLLGIGADTTNQTNLQKTIAESDTFYRTLINTTPNGIIVTDMTGKITFITKRAYQILRIQEGESQIGKSIFSRVAPESITMAKANFLEVVCGNRPPMSEEYKCVTYDKSEIWVEVVSSLLLDASGKRTGLMTVCRDVTDRRKIEEDLVCAKNKAEENDRLKTAFLHNISHEIRTPLNAIVGFSYLLDSNDLTRDQQKSYIATINKSSDHLLEIINDILEISDIEAGIVNVHESEVDLNNLIEDLFDRFRLDSESKGILMERYCGIRQEKLVIRTDKTKLLQILSNLLSNSLKFTDAGIIKFGYAVVENSILFFVSDTGKGIPEQELTKIFDRFYQIEHTGSRLYEGTGLGLSISKAYVELLGGEIWLTSRVAEGTTFNFTIPHMPDTVTATRSSATTHDRTE